MNGVFLAVFVLLQIADVWTTHKALQMGKREANPFLARLFEYFNPVKVMVAVKAVAVVALWYVAFWPLTAVLCVLYVWVVGNNLQVIRGDK
jgi:hypothetical protein